MNHILRKILTVSGLLILFFILIILMNYTFPIISDFISFLIKLVAPFIAGFVFAYLMVGIVDYLERKGLKRILAVTIVFFFFLAALIYLVASLIPIMINQISEFVSLTPQMFIKLDSMLAKLYGRFDLLPDKYRFTLTDIGQFIGDNSSFNPSINISSIFNIFNVVFLTPVATFYFLLEYHNIKVMVKRFIKRHNWFYFGRYLRELDKGMGSYLKGLFLVIHILAIVSTLIFFIVGLKYPVLFGLLIGYTNVIPYIGPYIGGAPAVLVAFTVSPQLGIIVILTIIALQALESTILTPYIQGKTVKIAPLYIVLAVSIFGKLFGIIGMIVAIPSLYFILLTTRYIRVYLRLKRIKKCKEMAL